MLKILTDQKICGLYYKTITIVIMMIVSDTTNWSITYDRNWQHQLRLKHRLKAEVKHIYSTGVICDRHLWSSKYNWWLDLIWKSSSRDQDFCASSQWHIKPFFLIGTFNFPPGKLFSSFGGVDILNYEWNSVV